MSLIGIAYGLSFNTEIGHLASCYCGFWPFGMRTTLQSTVYISVKAAILGLDLIPWHREFSRNTYTFRKAETKICIRWDFLTV